MAEPVSIAILGPGAVGGFLCAALYRVGISVTCIAREASCQLISEHGISIQSRILGTLTAHPRAVPFWDQPTDFIFITTKATNLLSALDRIGGCAVENSTFVPLLNGVEHIAVLRDRLGARVLASAIRIESIYVAPFEIVQTSPFAKIEIAQNPAVSATELRKLTETLSRAGISHSLIDDEQALLWGKLVIINPLACITAASQKTLGAIRSDPEWLHLLEGCVDETVAVAQREGLHTDRDTILAQIHQLPGQMTSSMHRDIVAGREPELDAIPGAVLRAGARYGLSCPVTSALTERIRARLD